MRLELRVIEARMRAPFVSSSGAVLARPLVLVALEDSDGLIGHGEAAPLHSYDGVSVEDVLAALEDCREVLEGAETYDRERLLDECARRAVLPQATAAIDLALWDLEGRRTERPVWQLLGAPAAQAVEVNATIAAPDRASAAREAGAALAAGFRCIKVKVGLGDDAGRLAAIRATAGSDVEIRLDANGAWSVPQASATLRALEPVGIELCEEPVSGLDDLALVCAETSVPVAIDESTVLPGALDERLCSAVCLKVSRFGGITGLLAAADRARAVGYEVYVASTLDGPLGIAAALHAAAAIRPDRACGLATLGMFELQQDSLTPEDGSMYVPPGAGLGTGLASWYAATA